MNTKNLTKSVGAVLAGVVAGAILSILMDTIIESTGIVPSAADQLKYGSPVWFLILATVYRCTFTILSGYITAKFAPSNPRRHVYILGTIALLANLGGGIAMWSFGQHWYPALLTVFALPSALWGGTLSTVTALTNNTQMQKEYASSEHDLRITRTFHAPVAKVWAAWTEAEHAKNWWSPKGFTTPHASIDFKVGGKTLNCMRDPSGKEVWSTGTFVEIVPMEKIVVTDSFSDKDGNIVPSTEYGMPAMPLELLVTVTFKAQGDTTVMTLLHQGMPQDDHYAGASQGWNEMFDKLEEFLQ